MKIHFEYPFKSKDIFEIKDNFQKYSHIKSNLEFTDCTIEDPEVSIVIPTFKNPETIFLAIESAICQVDAPKYEIIIVNNNPDESNEFIDRLKSLDSKKITYYKNEENIGLFGNWNRCIELAKSNQIVYLHADDLLSKDALHILWEYHNIVDEQAAILGVKCSIDKNGEIIKQYQNKKNLKASIIKFLDRKKYYKINKWSLFYMDVATGCGCMFNKNILMKLGGWNLELSPAADACLCILYQMHSDMYRIKEVTNYNRIAYNESFKVANLYPACNFFIRNRIVDLYFKRNRFLKYIVYLECISSSMKNFNIRSIRSLNIGEYFLVLINKIFFKIMYLSSIGK